MCNKGYLFKCILSLFAALFAIPAVCLGYYLLFLLVTFLGN